MVKNGDYEKKLVIFENGTDMVSELFFYQIDRSYGNAPWNAENFLGSVITMFDHKCLKNRFFVHDTPSFSSLKVGF